MHVVEKGYANTYADSKIKQRTNGQNGQENVNKVTNYYFSSANEEVDKWKSMKLTKEIHNIFGDVFNGIGCFKGTFSLQLKPDSKLYQVPLRHVVYALQKPFKDELHSDLRLYWSYRDDLVVMDGVVMKSRQIIIPTALKQQVLDQLHTNHTGIEKIKLLAHESIYWVDINTDIEKHIQNCTMCLEFQQMQPKEKIIHYDIPLRP